jgi:hypothetical protein
LFGRIGGAVDQGPKYRLNLADIAIGGVYPPFEATKNPVSVKKRVVGDEGLEPPTSSV